MRGRKAEGNIRSMEILTLKELAIGNFVYVTYLPSLDKYTYHMRYVHIYPRNFVEDFDMMLAISNLEIFA